jgi:nitric oxide reductase NorQ protein
MNQISIEHMTAADFKPRPTSYVDVNEFHPIYEGLYTKVEQPKSLILVGPKGVGKSLSIAAFAAKKNIPIITFDCSEDVRRTHLIGNFILRGQDTPFVLGPIPTAFEVANEAGEAILVLEEINALTPQMQKILNGTTDFRRRVEVPECKKVFELKPGKKLWVTGTMNTAVYGGVYALNEDLKSRVRLLPVDYPTPANEKNIIETEMASVAKKLGAKDIDQVILLAHETRQKALDYALSTRDVVQVLEDFVSCGKETALRLALGKFEGEDKATVSERITSIFGVKIAA